ncbi:MAG: carbamoyl-phosphate synthase large subunit, partial [Stutzerimonas stutzeri]
AEDDGTCLHTRKADQAVALAGRGPAAYLDMDQLIAVAREQGCAAIHPGYGFLAENAEFARRCQDAGLTFVGPTPETLQLFGDKAAARALAERCAVPLVPGINQTVTPEQAADFLAEHGSVMLKALSGGGGRGMRAVDDPAQLAEAFARCASEALGAFGSGALYVEKRVRRARHIEVQVLGDGSGAVSHQWERDCSLQRRHQKLVEIAPSPGLDMATRDAIIASALRLAAEVQYRGIGTFEFLLDLDQPGRFYFMEANPRVQVEHTVTEQVTGVDLLHTQLHLAAGKSLAELNLLTPPATNGYAVQVRLNLETLLTDGTARPAAGVLAAYQPPSGPGLRVDGCGYAGYAVSPAYDSLVAKLIASASDYPSALRRAYRGLCEFRIEGVASNLHLLQNLLQRDEVIANQVDTTYVERQLDTLLAARAQAHPHRYFAADAALQNAKATVDAPPGTLALSAPNAGVLVSL